MFEDKKKQSDLSLMNNPQQQNVKAEPAVVSPAANFDQKKYKLGYTPINRPPVQNRGQATIAQPNLEMQQLQNPVEAQLPPQSQPAPQETIGTQQLGGRFSAVRSALNSRTQEIQKGLKPQIQQPAAPAPQPMQKPTQPTQQAQQPSGMGGDKSLPPPTTPQQPVDNQARMGSLGSLGSIRQTPSIVSREEFDRRMAFRRPEFPGGLRTMDVKPEESFQSQFRGISYDDYINAGGQLSPEMKEQQRQRMIDAAKKARIETKPAINPMTEQKPIAPKPVKKPAKKPSIIKKYKK